MEPVIECIISVLNDALSDLDYVDGSDFDQLIRKGISHYDQICVEMARIQDCPDRYEHKHEEVMTKLEKWNYELRRLIEKIDVDMNVQHIKALRSNNVISLSNEENNFLKVKKENRIKDLKYKIYKLIIKLDELIMSFDDDTSELNNEVIINNSNLFDDIDLRYKAAVSTESNVLQPASPTTVKNDKSETNVVDELKMKENHTKEESNYKYETHDKERNITNIKEVREDKRVDAPNNTQRKADSQYTKGIKQNLEIIHIKPIDKNKEKEDQHDDVTEPLIWTKFRYTINNGEFTDMDVGCIISSCKDTLQDKQSLMIMTKNLDDIPMKLEASYEVLSNIIQVEPASLDVEFDNEFPWKISIPYLMTRNVSKEVVIICHDMTTGTNVNLDTQELIFDDNKEGGFKLAEATLPSPSCICVVVSKRKIEKFKIDKRGSKFVSNIDPRVALTMPPNSVKINVNFEMSVLQIESGHLNELVSKITLNTLHSMSPILDIKSDYPRNFLKTVSLQIPIPNIPIHSNRGRAASARQQTSEKMVKRSKSAITRQISSEEDPVIKIGVYNFQENMWRTNNNLNFTINKNNDSVEIAIQNLSKQRIVVVRCDENFNDDHLYRSIDTIKKGLETRIVQFIIRQHVTEPNRIVIVTATPNRMDKIQKVLTQENFAEDTSLMSAEFVIQERSKLSISCKGNLEIEDTKIMTHRYNSQLPNRKEFLVKEIDKFAQKSKDFYQGFIVISEVLQNNVSKLWEAVINIPKIEVGCKKDSKDINDFDFQATDIINKHYLHFLSQQLGKDWMILGKYLKVAEVTIRRISNNPSIDGQTMAYECLLKWIKNATVYSNKVIVMEKALRSIGRFDLVQDLARRVLSDA